jgi:hypothetical protein
MPFLQGWEQYFFVNRSTMHAMCSQAPAVFELLPDPSNLDVWPTGRAPPTASVVLRDANATSAPLTPGAPGPRPGTKTVTYSITNFRKLLEASLNGFTVETYDKKKVSLEMSPECWTISDASRAAWRSAKVPEGSQFFNIFGTGFSTAYDVEYGSVEEPLDDVTDIARKQPVRNFTDIEGDCTVPLCCATAGACMLSLALGRWQAHKCLFHGY